MAKTSDEKSKRLAPVPVRFSRDELAQLDHDRAAMPRSPYIKWRVFDPATPPPRSLIKQPSADQQKLARALALLGRLTGLLNQIAKAIHIGRCAVSPDTEEQLCAALADTANVRRMLMEALGKADPP